MEKISTPRVVQISDIVNWHEKNEINISPKYQRNAVWNDKAKAYLMDTIIRGLPIPPIFIRQVVDLKTKKTYREIIDGQQRIRAIIEYVIEEKYEIKSSHNSEYGGMKYSDLPSDVQEKILQYEIIVQVILEKDDTMVYDMFARLNTNNVVLNKQEIRNAKYWGDYKVFINRLATKYREFFKDNGILNNNDLSRMRDAELVSSLSIVLTEGICEETPKFIDSIYEKYDKEFHELNDTENKFINIMEIILKIFDVFCGKETCFENKNYFYTLFAVIANQMYGISEDLMRNENFDHTKIANNIDILIERIIDFTNQYEKSISDKENKYGLYFEFNDFAKNHKIHTTSKSARYARIDFLNRFVGSENDVAK